MNTSKKAKKVLGTGLSKKSNVKATATTATPKIVKAKSEKMIEAGKKAWATRKANLAKKQAEGGASDAT